MIAAILASGDGIIHEPLGLHQTRIGSHGANGLDHSDPAPASLGRHEIMEPRGEVRIGVNGADGNLAGRLHLGFGQLVTKPVSAIPLDLEILSKILNLLRHVIELVGEVVQHHENGIVHWLVSEMNCYGNRATLGLGCLTFPHTLLGVCCRLLDS